MDDALVARWKQGEGAAATAVRNSLRTTAERVLSNPALRAAEGNGGRALVEDEERRREMTGAIAREVMGRGGDSAATLTALTLLSAARHAVEAMRVGRPMAGSAHLPAPVAVALALTPETLPPPQREAYQRHIETCSACSEDCRLAREIVRSAATATHDATPVQLDEAVHEHAADAMEAAAQAAIEDMERRSTRTEPSSRSEAARSEGRRTATRPTPRGSRRAVAEKRSSPLRAVVPLLVLAAAGAWWWRSQQKAELRETVDPAIAALADRTPPKIGENEDIPPYAEAGAKLLNGGDCRSAGARFRTARRSHPEDRRLWVLEGGSFVCAGDGPAALQALDTLAKDPEATPAALWYHAQARLLTGNAGLALEALDRVDDSKSPYAEQAKRQIDLVRAQIR